ncbi:endonuclease/exonuclease/phosphatase family protein [Treponema sp.]|uniref:endonuclease/exonuclease/phosphatase family protein n=1 Tax=Treponema sp. TaxID=166 RepID=UPI00298DA922|nr:endonuclease/exonuclease/phosphatase family protein [Treponema sp.]MCQ2240873.1 endonuclease/exonuclease/phosphatase family protein [Treponema sp.]
MTFKKVLTAFFIPPYSLYVFSVLLFLTSCTQILSDSVGKEGSLKVVNWNVQTFFDAVTTGEEYSEFVRSARWGKEDYVERLKRLCSVIKNLDADVFVMEEIENEGVVHDISNFLAGEWDKEKVYGNACFAKDEGSSIGCAVLSRLPVTSMTVHSLDVRSEEEDMPRMRPLMEIRIKLDQKELTLMVNHWKSKSGGEEETEKWRNREEGVLSELVSAAVEDGRPVLALGDFNRDINDFCLTRKGEVVLRRWKDGTLTDDGIKVSSPWFLAGRKLIQPGSYYYQEEWSRIDNMFGAGGVEFLDFYPAVEGEWCDSHSFVPNRYLIWNGTGYSDHLPIVGVVKF